MENTAVPMTGEKHERTFLNSWCTYQKYNRFFSAAFPK